MKAVWVGALFAGAAALAVILFLPRAVWSEIPDYEALWAARDGLPGTLADLDMLAARTDAVGWHARVLAARARVAAGEFAAAAGGYQAAIELRATTELRRARAEALEAAGARADALAEWERLLPRNDAVAAVICLEENPVRLAERLAAAGRPSDALALVASMESRDVRLVRARALAALGRHAEAADEFARYLEGGDGGVRVSLEYGVSLERAGRIDAARAVYRALGPAGADREGSLLERRGATREAAAAYLRSSDPEARWKGARLLESLGDVDAAISVYLDLAESAHRVSDDAALRAYLLGRETTDAAAAARGEERLPPALRWIAGLAVEPVRPVPTPPSRGRPASVRRADQLRSRAGIEWAEIELEFALRTADPAERAAIGAWFLQHDRPRAAYAVGVGLLATTPTRKAYELAYPTPWSKTVEAWASAYGVDPRIVYAVIREESNFLPTAVSTSDARGLMQLLPSTARWIAESKLRIPYREEELFDPDVNIRLGTWYLGYLLELFDGDPVRAIAAYNGGPGNVERWTAAAGVQRTADVPGALASIETREYLVKVIDTWLVYQSLHR